MPPLLTWKQMLWTGVVLSAIGVLARTFLLAALAETWGTGALNNPVLRWTYSLISGVGFELGVALVVFALVARAVRAARVPANAAERESAAEGAASVDPATRTRTAATMFWVGVALVVLGLIMQESLSAWWGSLSGQEDVGAGLARDVLTVVGGPLQTIAFPFGILLVAGSLVVRGLEARAAAVERVPAS